MTELLTPISIENLSYAPNGKTLLDRISLEIPSNTKTVIMGANGAGKSLLLRAIHGLIQPTSGTILWNGIPVDPTIQASQAMVFQRPVLLRRSAFQNITFVLQHIPNSQREAKARTILAEANLAQISATPARLLSGGEQQRLAIARAMAINPKVLFLDEPTSGLDPASTFAVEALINSAFAKAIKIVLVTHNLGQARRLADDIVFLHRGRLTESATATKFFENPKTAAAKAYIDGELFLDPEEKSPIS